MSNMISRLRLTESILSHYYFQRERYAEGGEEDKVGKSRCVLMTEREGKALNPKV